jgi:hypothetical protein
MPNSKDTISNRLQRALLEIAESPKATIQERLEAVAIILKVKEPAKKRDCATPRKQPKLASPAIGVLGTR